VEWMRLAGTVSGRPAGLNALAGPEEGTRGVRVRETGKGVSKKPAAVRGKPCAKRMGLE